jgi:NAD+-dependent farnesol dehydrogenase
MRVLVTGGTGYLGGAIVRALHTRGHVPVTFARRATAAHLPGTAIDGDIRDSVAVRIAARGVDAIVHAAALVSVWRRRSEEFDHVNVGGLHNAIDAARESGARLIYTSSFLALPPQDHDTPLEANDYQRTKVRALESARRAAADGMPLTILFPGVVYGPGEATEGNLVGRLVRDHLAGRLPGVIGADRSWSYAYIDDVAAAHVSAVEGTTVSGEYMVGGENAPQMRVFEIVRDVTSRRLPRRIPFAAATVAGIVEEIRARLLHQPPLLTKGVVQIFRHHWPMDSARSVRELNYRITPLRIGVERLLRQGQPSCNPAG